MKKILILPVIASVFILNIVNAQVTGNRNYTVSNTVKQPNITTTSAVAALTIQGKIQEVVYFDGLGRPIQKVQTEVSTGNKDLITPIEYDGFGREVKKFLPYAETGTNTPGSMRNNAYSAQTAFYSPSTTIDIARDENPYSQDLFEFSPLNRTREKGAPGSTWQPGTERVLKQVFGTNTLADAVRIWTVSNALSANAFGSYSTTAVYNADDLLKAITEDEHGKQVIEFKDREGKVILKKVQLTATKDNGSGAGHAGWLCTYYIYDELNQLRCVIQPRGVELISPNWLLTDATILAEQCFRYEYDERGRMIIKKVPGAGEVFMIYDPWDRLIFTQDAKMRAVNQYMLTKYDVLNRPVLTAIYTYTGTIEALRNSVNSSTTFRNEERTPNGHPAYTSRCFPQTGYEFQTITYYDDYTWTASYGVQYATKDNSFDAQFSTASNTTWPYPQALTQSNQTLGMVTGGWTRMINSIYGLTNAVFYDDKGRVIQTKTMNQTGAVDVNTVQYNWSGQPLMNLLSHGFAGGSTQTLITKMEYDDLGRVRLIRKKINSNAERIIVENSYDALGQLKTKKLAPAFNSNAGIENLTYDYNIRGWMLGMNRNYLTANGQSGTNRFGFELGYDKLTNRSGRNFSNAAQFNGNITGMVWKSDGDDVRRMYSFTYDAANRLMKADFIQHNNYSNDNTWGINLMNYTAQMGDGTNPNSAYDANGNILSMTQFGWKAGASPSTPIDQLTYGYITNSNRLRAVVDQQNDPNTVLGDFRTPASHPQNGSKNVTNINSITDYSYDVNGNMIQDHNKAITNITYNYLNLPHVITTAKGTITYTYDAAGNKLSKEVNETANAGNGNTNTYTATYYISGFVYETKVVNGVTQYSNKLQFTGHEEGRIRALYTNAAAPHTLTGFAYDYMLKDHLGNVRMVLTDEQQINYYPAATLEGTFSTNNPQANSMVNHEKRFYNIQSNRIVNKPWTNTFLDYANHNGIPPGTPNPNYPSGVSPTQSATSTKVYQLNASTNRTGLEFVMKVMAGDKIDILGRSYHTNTTTVSNTNSTTLNLLQVVTALLGAPANAVGSKGISATQLESWNNGILPSGFIRGNNNETGTSIPKAYVNYIFLDEQFKYAGGGWSRVGASGTVKQHWTDGLQNINVPKNGYVFVYVSNESNFNVFFDNLQVVHTRGTLVEETHYYPFGLTMAGISSKAAGTLQNKEKTFQGQQIDDDLGLNWIQFKWRNHDPQLGRFVEIDPLSEEYEYNSTYAFSENRVTSSVEIEGLEAKDLFGELGPVREHRQKNGIPKSESKGEKLLDANLFLLGTLVTMGAAEIIPGVGIGATILKQESKDSKPLTSEKKVPNPNGKKGGDAHQQKVAEVEKELQSNGMNTKREVEVKTPGGNKEKRYVDVEGKNPQTGEVKQVQVGKQNKNGTPVSREVKAMNDIEKATGNRPDFRPYNNTLPINKY
jgi:RHS repeat-associated protein